MYPIFCKVDKGYKPWVFMVINVISKVLVQDGIKCLAYGTSRKCWCVKDITRGTSDQVSTYKLKEYQELMEGETLKVILQDNDPDIPLCKFVYHKQLTTFVSSQNYMS